MVTKIAVSSSHSCRGGASFSTSRAFAETAFMTRHYRVAAKAIHPSVRMGHVHLKVADLERAVGFYRDVLGFELTQRFGSSAAFLSAGGYHHHIGLNTWESEGGRPPAEGTTGLYHLAILYPTRAELGDALRRLQKAGVPLEGASDHGVSEALYLRDPDANGVELYWDRPKEEWPRTSDGLAMYTRPLDLASLSAAGGEDVTKGTN
jgi:catechol 2,3-dioxygenase